MVIRTLFETITRCRRRDALRNRNAGFRITLVVGWTSVRLTPMLPGLPLTRVPIEIDAVETCSNLERTSDCDFKSRPVFSY